MWKDQAKAPLLDLNIWDGLLHKAMPKLSLENESDLVSRGVDVRRHF